MKAVVQLTIFATLLVINAMRSQDFKGVATYKTATSISITMDSTKVDNAEQERMNAMIRKAMQKEFELKFNKEASSWKEVESLGDASPDTGVRIVAIGSGSGGVLYKNTKDKIFRESADVFGKQFLIKDELEGFDWKLENETKQIGQYTCYKATATREITVRTMSSINKGDDGDKDKKEETKTQTITAWYTPQIPVSHGPDEYWGLPGLILEVSNGSRVMICNKIVLNPKDEIQLEIPDKGKEVNREAYRKILDEKMEEMNKMYKGGRKKTDGNSISIQIGG